MAINFHFDPVDLPPECKELRQEVRALLREEIDAGTFSPHSGRSGAEKSFARKVGARGWIGMTWPKRYGGHERTALERYVVLEEMLAAGAPVGGHWVADRQSGPLLLRVGTDKQKDDILPRIAAGSAKVSLAWTEPNARWDAAGIIAAGREAAGGFVLSGTKLFVPDAVRPAAQFTKQLASWNDLFKAAFPS